MGKILEKTTALLKKFSIEELSAYLLSIPRKSSDSRGLVMIQIDGLANSQFRKALESGKLPFIKKILSGKYNHFSLYSGIPSTTPAVQGELFYGVKCAVPAFGFFNRQSGMLGTMLSQQITTDIENNLKKKSRSILEGGSAYSDIYSGNCHRALFCSASFGLNSILKKRKILHLLILSIFHWLLFFRIIALLIVELFLSFIDLFRGIISKQNLFKEITFIPQRVAICVAIRELIVASASIDCARGVPIIHCNFIGYDEQSHRRGPSSAFAHWTLKGIDDSVRRIVKAAQNSSTKKYSFIIYSDHGQEEVKSYSQATGKSLYRVLFDIFNQPVNPESRDSESGIEKKRGILLGTSLFKNIELVNLQECHNQVIVSSVGPLAHIYFSEPIDTKAKREFSKLLVNNAKIPSVLFSDKGEVYFAIEEGCFALKKQNRKLLGEDHPFLDAVTEDLERLVHHIHAGDLVFIGWRAGGKSVSFPQENGAHAGPGREETHGFAILPKEINPGNKPQWYIRPEQLYKVVKAFLENANR